MCTLRIRHAIAYVVLCLAVLLAAGCNGSQAANDNATPAAPAQPPTTQPALPPPSEPDVPPPVVAPQPPRVDGNEAEVDLGNVAPESEHVLNFNVVNPDANALTITRVRSDCECISGLDVPPHVPAGGEKVVKVRFVAPKVEIPYRTRLILVTDRTDRRIISLYVKSRIVKP